MVVQIWQCQIVHNHYYLGWSIFLAPYTWYLFLIWSLYEKFSILSQYAQFFYLALAVYYYYNTVIGNYNFVKYRHQIKNVSCMRTRNIIPFVPICDNHFQFGLHTVISCQSHIVIITDNRDYIENKFKTFFVWGPSWKSVLCNQNIFNDRRNIDYWDNKLPLSLLTSNMWSL